MATLQNIGKLKYRGKDGQWLPLPVVVQDADGSVSTISGKGAPTSATQGKVNQLYRDEDTQRLYICTATDGGYTWAAVSGGSVDVDATLTKAGDAADAKAAGDAIEKKLDKAQGVESAGMILGVDEDGNVVPQNKPAQAIAGAAAPTTATAGVVGQEYYVITDGVVAEMYVCTAAANGTYAWNKVELGAEIDDTSTETTKVWSAKKSNQLSQNITKLKEKKAEIDDTAVGAYAWSSKNIVDMLCPPLEESGNPVVCYPVAGYPLGVKAKWEPVQEGSGTPSPENIRPIKGRDSVTVTRCGANLCNPKKVEHFTYNPYGLTIQYVGDNRIHLHGTYTYSSDGSFAIMDTDQPLLAGRGLKIYGFLVDGKAKAFSLYGLRTASETVIAMSTIGWKPGDAVEMTISIVITNSTTAPTAYTPYIGQTNTLILPETIYGGSVDAVSGDGKQTWKLLTLDGTENWNTWGVNANNAAVTGFYTFDVNDYKAGNEEGICSHLPSPSNDTWGGRNEGVGFASGGGSRHLICSMKTKILDDASSDVNAITSWKAYLAAQYAAGTPVQVAYKLATPVPFTATGGAALPALDGANTVITDADSVDVTGRADPIKRIADLEVAVASIE